MHSEYAGLKTQVKDVNSQQQNWSVDQSNALYGISGWGADWFGVSDNGEVTVITGTNGDKVEVSLCEIVDGLRERGLDMPVMLRIANHLDYGVCRINEAFAAEIESQGYRGRYRGVFPIKVNQQSHIVTELARYGERYQHGLEAGSKAELLIAMATIQNTESLIICNGYKDEEFIDLGLNARQLGLNCIFVIETLSEAALIVERSRQSGIRPVLGVRIKLSTQVEGHWAQDSGARSLFGLSNYNLMRVVDMLKQADMLDCLQLLHFHLGSQIPNIRNIRVGVEEACRYYQALVGEGAPLAYLDMGGGLAVDYDGSLGSTIHSRNYSLKEYCADIIDVVKSFLDEAGLPHPDIVTESGRATVAYASVLLFNVLDVEYFTIDTPPEKELADNPYLSNLWEAWNHLSSQTLQECYNDALYEHEGISEYFLRGDIDLRTRAQGDHLFRAIMQKIVQLLPSLPRIPAELEQLPEQLADIYYANFSVFQSLPDAWAIGQVFPVLPIHRLNEKPSRVAIIADLTCDCDGKLNNFSTGEGQSKTLPVHPLRDDEEYYLGVFLVGAYQETLGDLHNLFGDTHVASVRINEDGSFHFEEELHGDSIADVLSYVEYEPQSLMRQFRTSAEKAVREGKISVAERRRIIDAYADSLRGYTYYER